jgi:hypothetical protein
MSNPAAASEASASTPRPWHNRGVAARLYHERIARDAPARWLALTHGIYGAGSNWRGIARKVNEQRPEWGIVLVDLRQHGRSEPGQPPHDLAACAADLRALIDDVPVDAVAGHSFGGKVVLALREVAPRSLLQTWVFDASPSARRDTTSASWRVLELMERLPRTWARRDDFVAEVVAAGFEASLAQWLAMNVVADARGELALRLDLGAMRELLVDYFTRDLWSVALDPALPGTLEVVIADRSDAIDAQVRARLASAPAHVRVHHVSAGHWLHVDAPSAVIELFAQHLP